MRILMTTDTVGGVFTYAVDLCRALDRHGVEVVLAAMGPSLAEDRRTELRALPNVRFEHHRGALEWMDDPWDDVDAAGRWLLELCDRHAVELVHANGYAEAALPFRRPVVGVGHSCVASWFREVRREPAPPPFDEYRHRVRRGLHAADVVVAPTEWMLDTLDELYGPLPVRRRVPNGRELAHLRPREPAEPFVLCAGRLWDEAKNVEALVRAAGSLSWPVCVAGDDRAPDGRANPALDGERVRVLGRLSAPALAEVMASAAIYALPARYEPFGLSVLEAAASGCALVLGDIPSLRETWDDAAVFVPPDDHEALAHALEHLAGSAEARRSLAARARLRSSRFTAAAMARGYLEIYSELVLGRGLAFLPADARAHLRS